MSIRATYGKFSSKGKIVRMESEEKDDWITIKIKLKTSQNSFLKTELIGKKKQKVKMIDNKYNRDSVIEVDYEIYKKMDKYRLYMPIKLSFHNASRVAEYTAYEAIEAIVEHFEVGDYVYINGSIQHSIKNDKHFDNFIIREMGFTNDSNLPSNERASFCTFDQDVVLKKLIDNKSVEVIVISNNKNGYQYIDLTMNIENNEVYEVIKTLPEGQLLNVCGYYHIYAPLIEINGHKMFKSEVVKQFSITGGTLRDKIYDMQQLQPKGDSLFVKKEVNDERGF